MSELKLRPLINAATFCRSRLIASKIAEPSSFGLNCNPQLVELNGVDVRRRFGHQIYRGCCLCKGDHFAQGFFASEEHGDAVDAEGDTTVGRRAVRQRVEKKSEAPAQLFLAQTERAEETLLNI